MAIEAYTGLGRAAGSIVATWRSEDPIDCAYVQVERQGMATWSECVDGSSGSARLSDADLERFYVWLDRYQSFDRTEDGATVSFEGLGTAPSDEALRADIGAWLGGIAAERWESPSVAP